MRLVALLLLLPLCAFALLVRARAGVYGAHWQGRSRRPVWIGVAYCALGVLANAVTPSPWERIVRLPVVIGMFAASVVVARSQSTSASASA